MRWDDEHGISYVQCPCGDHRFKSNDFMGLLIRKEASLDHSDLICRRVRFEKLEVRISFTASTLDKWYPTASVAVCYLFVHRAVQAASARHFPLVDPDVLQILAIKWRVKWGAFNSSPNLTTKRTPIVVPLCSCAVTQKRHIAPKTPFETLPFHEKLCKLSSWQ